MKLRNKDEVFALINEIEASDLIIKNVKNSTFIEFSGFKPGFSSHILCVDGVSTEEYIAKHFKMEILDTYRAKRRSLIRKLNRL